MTNHQRIRKILRENKYCVLATASRRGQPWASPVYFVSDTKFNLYWTSAKTSKHSRLIRANPKVAISIFNSQAEGSDVDGLYLQTRARELTAKDLPPALKIYAGRDNFDPGPKDDFLGTSPIRMYQAVPSRMWLLGPERKFRGKFVDTRVALSKV